MSDQNITSKFKDPRIAVVVCLICLIGSITANVGLITPQQNGNLQATVNQYAGQIDNLQSQYQQLQANYTALQQQINIPTNSSLSAMRKGYSFQISFSTNNGVPDTTATLQSGVNGSSIYFNTSQNTVWARALVCAQSVNNGSIYLAEGNWNQLTVTVPDGVVVTIDSGAYGYTRGQINGTLIDFHNNEYIIAGSKTRTAADYTIYAETSVYKAQNATGAVVWSSTNFGYVVNLALAACYNVSGGTVCLSSGSFVTTLSIDIKSNCELVGAGRNATKLLAGANIPVLTATNATNIYVGHLTINGQKSSFANSTGLLFYDTQRTLADDIMITNCGGNGAWYVYKNKAYENIISRSWIGGDIIDGGPTYPYGNNGYGIILAEDSGAAQSCTVFQNGLSGIKMASTSKVSDCTIWGNAQNGVYAANVSDIEILNNIITDNRANGILLDGSWRASVHDNQIRDNSKTINVGVYDGIRIANITSAGYDNRYNQIYSNKIFDDQTPKSQNYAINISSGVYNYIHDNYVQENLNTICYSASTYYFIYDNIGFKTYNDGSATITAGSNFVTVAHGLVGTPRMVLAGSVGTNMSEVWVSNIGDTSFTINVAATSTSDVSMRWEARWGPYGLP